MITVAQFGLDAIKVFDRLVARSLVKQQDSLV